MYIMYNVFKYYMIISRNLFNTYKYNVSFVKQLKVL